VNNVAINVSLVTSLGHNVTIPFSAGSGQQATVAQSDLNYVNMLVAANQFPLDIVTTPGTITAPAETTPSGLVVNGSGNYTVAGVLDSHYVGVIVDGAATVTGVGSATDVITGNQATLTWVNGDVTGTGAEIELGGGNNYIVQASHAIAHIGVGGPANQALGSDKTIVDAHQGASTSIDTYGNSFTDVIAGSGVSVSVHDGVSFLQMGGAATIPATVSMSDGSDLIYMPDGGSAIINPQGGHLVIMAPNNAASRETLLGGTGATTLFGGSGNFTGGSGGHNYLQSSTVAGAATLHAGGSGDVLESMAAGNTLMAGSADGVTLFADTSVAGGNTFVGGSHNATMVGGYAGGNTFQLGSGTDVVEGHSMGNATLMGSGDVYSIVNGGGTHFIADFVVGKDVFNFGAATVTSSSYVSNSTVTGGYGSVGTELTLSDGTHIEFGSLNVLNSIGAHSVG